MKAPTKHNWQVTVHSEQDVRRKALYVHRVEGACIELTCRDCGKRCFVELYPPKVYEELASACPKGD